MAIVEGWKLVRKDGSTYGGYRWPMPIAGVTDPVVVEAHDINPDNKTGCPSRPGDGLCVALTPVGASSGGIALSEGVGLSLTYDESDVLGREDTKLRVAKVTVVDTFDPLARVRDGEWKDLSWANLPRADLAGANLSRTNLSRANFTGANLSGANLTRAVLYGAYLSRADLYGADLSRANLSRADLYGADLTRANLSRANLAEADLSRADLSRANLSRTNLSRADLAGANLTRADLSEADLTRTNLSRTNLTGTDLSGANLSRANFTGACGEPVSGMPDGWRLDAQGRWERDQ